MASSPASPRAAGDPPGERVLLVAVCGGGRCEGLHRLRRRRWLRVGTLQRGDHDGGFDVCDPLRQAVRARADGVLMRSECLGHCVRGSVAAVGEASVNGSGSLTWRRPPVMVTAIDLPDRMRALAEWIRSAAPGLDGLPALLRDGRRP